MRLVLLGLVLLAGCAPTVQTVTFRSPPPAARPADAPVRIYELQRPTCPFEEVGRVTVSRRNKFTSLQAMNAALMAAARAIGGDAIVAFSQEREVTGATAVVDPDAPLVVGTTRVRRSPVLGGIVVRFTDPSCQR